MNYIPLDIKTNYELLTSLIKTKDLITFAKSNKITSIAITDSNMFYDLGFYNECIKNDIKPIIGVTFNLENIKFNLYAKNYNGYKNLCKLVTERNLNKLTFDYILKNCNDLKCILFFESIDYYKKIKEIFSDTYISYTNSKERNTALLVTENVVYMNTVLCLEENDLKYLKYLWMLKDGKTISDKPKYNIKEQFLKKDITKIDIDSTIEFSNDLKLEFPEFKYELPKFSEKSDDLLKSLCKKGLKRRLNGKISTKYVERLKYEISVIEQMGYTDYFLIVYDFILYAKKNNIIVGPGRGSGAGSLVCYALGIIDIDPIKFDLIFERFLNPDRVTMPDIDVDFEHIRRDEVVEYVRKKYGTENVANIVTFGTLLPKQVIRDVGRVLELDIKEIDNICKQIKDKETFEDLKNNENFLSIINSKSIYKKLVDISRKFEGLKRHTSTHAAGVVISKTPLTDKMPLIKSGNNIITSYSMEYMEELGLLKMDFLGLKNLTIIDNMIKGIFYKTGKRLKLSEIPFNDEKTLNLFYNANTVGIFQFESNGMKSFLKKLKVTKFDDIVAAISLYRPGPRENIDLYIKRKEGKIKIDYLHPLLEPILKDTYGIMIYQEQIIETLKSIAGYTYAEADNIRRAMSKKKEDIILAEKTNFIEKSIKNGVSREKANDLFELIKKFSNYGFNKSHSVAYAYICYYMAYLKAHYPSLFLSNILNIHIGSEIKTKEYIDEARILNLYLEKPSVNNSTLEYKALNNKIIFPLSVVKGVGKEATSAIINARDENIFTDPCDFVKRVYSSKVNKKVLISLIEAGCLDIFKETKKTLIENLDNLIDYAILCKDIESDYILKPVLKKYDEYEKRELMKMEYDAFGFYLSMHPVTKFKRDNMVLLKVVENYFDKIINSVLLIESIKNINTKNNEKMTFVTLSDEYKKIEGVIFPKTLKIMPEFNKGDVVKITAKVEKRIDSYQLIVNNLEVLK